MAILFTPPVNPSFPLSTSEKHRVKTMQFGDGYKQKAVDGLNATIATITLKWEGLTAAEKDTIMAFFRARRGTQPFRCSFLTGRLAGAKFTCEEYDDEHRTANTFDVSATLEQDFSI